MRNTQPGAASTTKLPLFSSVHHGRLVWVYSALASTINAERLVELEAHLDSKAYRTALIGGLSALQANACEYVRQARDEGNLLLCWFGTRALEVPA